VAGVLQGEKKRVLGIDPGLRAMGYGVVESSQGKAVYVSSGTITTRPKDSYAQRLRWLHDEVGALIQRYKPQVLVMERPIYCQNVKTALTLGQVGGMAILAAIENDVALVEFTPAEVKQAVAGKGRAAKDQVEKMTRVLLSLSEALPSSHASDALACAICYVHSEKRLRLLQAASGTSPSKSG